MNYIIASKKPILTDAELEDDLTDEDIQSMVDEAYNKSCQTDVVPHATSPNEKADEMPIEVEAFEKVIKRVRGHIYNQICSVCCLEALSSADNNRVQELFDAVNVLFEPVIEGGVSKNDLLLKHFIEPCLSPDTFEPEEDDLFIRAMNFEMSQASKPNTPNQHYKLRSADFIRENILPNITMYRQANAKRIAKLLNGFMDAVEYKNADIMKTAKETFMNTMTETNLNITMTL
ncbi:MAG: hypothetical protein NC453_12315 [Muribaculum sp.]|nr:hypothetical protein [Muribaculum sp.]